MERSYYTQQDRLKTLIENLGSGLIFIDASGHIVLVNKTYRETFRLNTDSWIKEKFQEMLPQKEVIGLVNETFLTETGTLNNLISVFISFASILTFPLYRSLI